MARLSLLHRTGTNVRFVAAQIPSTPPFAIGSQARCGLNVKSYTSVVVAL